MSIRSVAEAKERVPECVELAPRGEPVAFTRDARPVAERIQPMRRQPVEPALPSRHMRDGD